MLQEDFKDAAEILQTIVTQPLNISGATAGVSLLSAARDFKKEEALESDLHKVLLTFHDYPGPTQTLVTELNMLVSDLSA